MTCGSRCDALAGKQNNPLRAFGGKSCKGPSVGPGQPLARGDPSGAATDAAIVLELEPYLESAHVLLMKAHVASGNPAQALAAYQRLRTRLAEDLGTLPSAETETVFLDVLRTGQT